MEGRCPQGTEEGRVSLESKDHGTMTSISSGSWSLGRWSHAQGRQRGEVPWLLPSSHPPGSQQGLPLAKSSWKLTDTGSPGNLVCVSLSLSFFIC